MGAFGRTKPDSLAFRSALAVFGFFFILLTGETAEAAFGPPAMWTDMDQVDLSTAIQAPLAPPENLLNPDIPDGTLDHVLKDRDNRISATFKVPKELAAPVAFWLKIYTIYTTQQVVLFDSRHPDVIYETLDFRPVAKTAKSRLVYEVIVKNRLAKTLAAYKTAFNRLARNPRPLNPSREERLILQSIRLLPHKHTFADLAKHVRTQTGQRDNIMLGLSAAETFFPKMELIFTQMKIPAELTRLSLVESSFTYSAISRLGAAGVWQFMPDSGREYLTIDDKSGVDERLSPLKSTVAAGKLLKRNYRVLKHWALAVTSYNNGLRSLRRIAEADDFSSIAPLFNLCSKKRGSLGWASRNYYSEFLAVLHAEAYRDVLYGDIRKGTIRPLAFREFGRARDALNFALSNGITIQEFRALNPDIRRLDEPLPQGFLLAVPADQDNVASLFTTGARKTARAHPRHKSIATKLVKKPAMKRVAYRSAQ